MNKNILTFDEWAILGKDKGMEKGHNASVQHMLKDIFKYYEKNGKQYSPKFCATVRKTANFESGAVKKCADLVDLKIHCNSSLPLIEKNDFDTAENAPSKAWATNQSSNPPEAK